MRAIVMLLISLLSLSTVLWAGEADVVEVDIKQTGENTYYFKVTVRHADEGWDHFANKWDVVAPDGKILGTRTLYHPHVDEQPFARSLSDVNIPASITEITVRAHDSVHGDAPSLYRVELPR